jgi:lysosomal alpha-glucosidase
LALEVDIYDFYVRFTIKDPNNNRWDVSTKFPLNNSSKPTGSNYIDVKVTDAPFGLTITRKKDNSILFNFDANNPFKFNDKDIIITNQFTDSKFVYGVGERVAKFNLGSGIYTIFNKDNALPIDTGAAPGGKQVYGAHPMYIAADGNGEASGGLLYSTNAMDVTIVSESPNSSISFRPIGGIIDFYVFYGPTPTDVV